MAAIRGWLLFLSMSSRYNYYYSGCIFLVYLNKYMVLSGEGAVSFEKGNEGLPLKYTVYFIVINVINLVFSWPFQHGGPKLYLMIYL